jgi:hypothetical protein
VVASLVKPRSHSLDKALENRSWSQARLVVRLGAQREDVDPQEMSAVFFFLPLGRRVSKADHFRIEACRRDQKRTTVDNSMDLMAECQL